MIFLWETRSGRLVRTLAGHDKSIHSLAFSTDGTRLVSGSSDGSVRVWAVATGKELVRLEEHAGPITGVFFANGGRGVVWVTSSGGVGIWEPESGARLGHAAAEDLHVSNMSLACDGKTIVTAGSRRSGKDWDETLCTRSLSTGKWRQSERPVKYPLCGVTASPREELVATRSGGWIQLWDLSTLRQRRRFKAHDHDATTLAFAPDGKVLASADALGEIRFWEVSTGKRLPRSLRVASSVGSMAYSPAGDLIAVACEDNFLHLWDVNTGVELHGLAGHASEILGIAFSLDGKAIVTAAEDGTVRVWGAATGRQQKQWELDLTGVKGAGGLRAAGLCSVGSMVACSGHSETAIVDFRDGHEVCRLPRDYSAITFSPDGKSLAAATACAFSLWDVATGVERWKAPPWKGPGEREYGVFAAYSPDGKLLALSAEYRGLRATGGVSVWEVATRRVRYDFQAQTVRAPVAFSLDGSEFAFPNPHGAVDIREAQTGRLRQAIPFPWSDLAGLCWSPDGRLLAGAYAETILVWEVRSGRIRCRFRGHAGAITCLAFAPDGKAVASGSCDTTGLVWDVTGVRSGLPPLSRSGVEEEWRNLSSADAGVAHRAIWRLIAAPEQSLPLLRAKVKPVTINEGHIARLVSALESDRFREREEADRKLADLGELAEPALRATARNSGSAEARRRADRLLDQIDRATPTSDELRLLRAVEILEYIANAEARRILERLATGVPQSRTTRDAKASLVRLRNARK
jgi:WD40 repeat protein